ncbi:ThiF family adenylyltransferase [Glutamicibacter sp. JC586]|uniref:ThiF family adenylyltransferase n=1 Tax=Glutamicibacter sp. JC586 TaxID=2590552 RepID=UPI00135A8242|nr:ThiF family adenylyltransferase [Glutamicibacter sp. JC586]
MTTAPLCEPAANIESGALARYSRHLTLPGVGETGQRRIMNAKVLIIGAGGLGSPIASYLIAAGVGHIAVVDDDTVELSNLQRQIIHREADTDRPKVDSVIRYAREHNSGVQVQAINERLNTSNALALFADYDVVVDGSDNFATRYLASDAAEISGTPLVWGTLFQFSGQVSVFDPRTGPMLRDLFPELPDADSVPSCAEGGVFGALCGVVGSVMSIEVLKLITGVGRSLSGKLWLYDALEHSVNTLGFAPDPERQKVTELGNYQPVVCAMDQSVAELSVGELIQLQSSSEVLIVDVREDWEREIIAIPGSLHLPLATLDDEIATSIPGEAPVVMVCKTGVRSAQAAKSATKFLPQDRKVYSLVGGTLAWHHQVEGEKISY